MVTMGLGLTKTVAVIDVPSQPLKLGVMVKVTVIAAPLVLVKLPLIFPVPLAAIPLTVAVLSLIQLNVVAATVPVKFIGKITFPEQLVCAAFVADTFGFGLTETVAVTGIPLQPLAVEVTVKVTV